MLIKQKILLLGIGTFGKFANTVPNKSESDIPLPFNGSLVLSHASGKEKFLSKSFLRFLIMMVQVSFYLFFLLELN